MSSASAAEGTPESRRLLEDIQNMVQANILLERAINAVCETRNQGLVWFGTPCSSFVQLCKYSTGRNITNDWMTGWEMNTDRWQPDKAMSSCM